MRAGDIDTLANLSEEELIEIDGVGEKVADSVIAYFENPENIKEIHRLFHHGVKPEKIQTKAGHPFQGKSFVLTGSLENLSRSEAAALIKERGGKVSSSVSKKTDYILVGADPGSKYEKAKELNIPILTEEEFTSLLD
jgi:DNA ligase (NAD+)